MEEIKKKKFAFAVPHVYILLLGIVLVCSILTYVIPAGQYNMVTITTGATTRDVVDPATFHSVAQTPVSLMQLLSSVTVGMQQTAQIIFFIFIVGGAFAVLEETKAIEAGMGKLIKFMKGKTIIIIPIVMIAFSLGGSVFGWAESTIPFIPIFVAMCVAMGYDSITGTAIVLCGAGAGFAGAFINPFTIQVAQGIAQLPLLSGLTFRIVMYICMVTLTVAFVMRYASKVKKDPQLSLMYDYDKTREESMDLENLKEFTAREKAILVVFLLAIILLVVGVLKWGWYMDEIAALFFGMSMIAAAIGRLGFNNYATTLGKGMAGIASGALVVGFARAILVVLNDGNILHPILHVAAAAIAQLPSMTSAIGMYIFQCLLSFIVPSGSGQAAVSLPIMAPLSDLVGVSRQTAVIAFQLGDGISNIFTPTSGYFMAGLALARVPWLIWAKWILPLIGLQYLLGAIFIAVAQAINLGPF